MVFKPDVISKGCLPLRAGVSEAQAVGCEHGLRFDFDQPGVPRDTVSAPPRQPATDDLDQEKPLRGSNKQPECARV
jgi:hypothetical protein